MSLVHIVGHVYAHPAEIAKVEGFPLTLCIKVTLRDGSVFERFVAEKALEWWTSVDNLERRIGIENNTWRRAHMRKDVPAVIAASVRVLTREEAFGAEFDRFMRHLNKKEVW